MVSDDVKQRLAGLVENTGKDLGWAVDRFEAKRSEVEERTMEDFDDNQIDDLAFAAVKSQNVFDSNVGSYGEAVELEILAIGQGGRIDDWGDDNISVVYSYGFIYGPIGDNGEEKAARAVMVNRDVDGLDLTEVQRKFHALNTISAVYEVSESRDLDGVYRCFSNESTELEEGKLDSLPDERQPKVDILRKAVPEASLATLHEDLSAYDPDTGYTYEFGADLRRIQANVVDYYIPDDRSWGRYTIMDDSVTEDDIVGTDIVGDDQNVPGLTVWADPDHHMEYGQTSRLEFYGSVEEGQDGNLNMNLVGVIPIVPMPMEDEDGENSSTNAKSTEDSL